MVNQIDLPTEIERFGQVFFCQSQFVIGAICCTEQPVSANIITGNMEYFVLHLHLPVQGRVGHIRLPISDLRLRLIIGNCVPCHEQETQGAV